MPNAISRDSSDFFSATRIQRSLVASAEKRVLTWLARRTPAWVNSDHLTILGFIWSAFATQRPVSILTCSSQASWAWL
jgi:hypothetical protein